MKVKELIEKLQEFNPEDKVCIGSAIESRDDYVLFCMKSSFSKKRVILVSQNQFLDDVENYDKESIDKYYKKD